MLKKPNAETRSCSLRYAGVFFFSSFFFFFERERELLAATTFKIIGGQNQAKIPFGGVPRLQKLLNGRQF